MRVMALRLGRPIIKWQCRGLASACTRTSDTMGLHNLTSQLRRESFDPAGPIESCTLNLLAPSQGLETCVGK